MSTRAGVLILAIALGAPAAYAADPAPKAPAKPAAKAPAAKAAKPQVNAAAATPKSASQPSAFKLKPGANGALCLDCHGNFTERLNKASVHTPVRSRNCVACHNPHASNHGKLLGAEPSEICITCHSGIVPKAPKSSHKPVAENRCADCHDPHASGFKNNLVRGGTDLCGGCHADIVDAAKAAKFKHQPVEESCAACHEPHGSAKALKLLKSDVPGLCLGCHNLDSPMLSKKHMGYPVKQANCTSCHDPHGSNSNGLFYATVHPPVAKAQCSMCHEPPTSKNPLATRQQGVTLCRQCHTPALNKFMANNRVHQPVAEGACLACHGPHASKEKGLVKANMVAACGTCHGDTIRRQELSPTKHKPIKQGDCTACHNPHGSSAALFFVNQDGIELCGKCHDWQKHSTHPIGDTKRDPRNKNLFLECSSCHRSHGTDAKHLIPYPKTSELCTKCHEQYKR